MADQRQPPPADDDAPDATILFAQAKGLLKEPPRAKPAAPKPVLLTREGQQRSLTSDAVASIGDAFDNDPLSIWLANNAYLLAGCGLVAWQCGWAVGLAAWLLAVWAKRCQ